MSAPPISSHKDILVSQLKELLSKSDTLNEELIQVYRLVMSAQSLINYSDDMLMYAGDEIRGGVKGRGEGPF